MIAVVSGAAICAKELVQLASNVAILASRRLEMRRAVTKLLNSEANAVVRVDFLIELLSNKSLSEALSDQHHLLAARNGLLEEFEGVAWMIC